MRVTIYMVLSARKHARDQHQETGLWLSTVGLILTLALGLLVVPCATDAQQPVKLIGLLINASPPFEGELQYSLFQQKLRELGWQEGHNIAFERRYTEEQSERLPDLAAALVRLRPDIIVTGGTPGARAAQQATTTIPIVLWGAGLLVERGIVASLAHPGGNITGVETTAVGLSGKRVEILKDALPRLARVAYLYDRANPFFTLEFPNLETDARALGVQLQPVAVRVPDEFDAAFATIIELRPDALLIADDATFYPHLQQIVGFATTHRLPTMGARKQVAEAGSLLAFGYSFGELRQRAAVYVDKILRDARPGDLPIERPTTFELVLNLKTAKALGITIPPLLLFRADEVIQ
jgi:putative ABC transport system substrate-binding protein